VKNIWTQLKQINEEMCGVKITHLLLFHPFHPPIIQLETVEHVSRVPTGAVAEQTAFAAAVRSQSVHENANTCFSPAMIPYIGILGPSSHF